MRRSILAGLVPFVLAGCGSSEDDSAPLWLSTGGGDGASGGGSAVPSGGVGGGGPSTGATSGTTPSGGSSSGGVGGSQASPTGGAASGGGSSVPCNGPPLSGGTQHCTSNGQGVVGAYTWSIWSSGSGGCITPHDVGAAFHASWNNSGDFLARVGLQWNETQTFDQLGILSADFAYTKSGTGGGYSYIGIYGWSNDPLIEYYIVEDTFGSSPPNITWGDGVQTGTLDVDDGTYKIFTHTQVNQPSIHGTQTFPQFFSVRQTFRQCGHISITEHFRKWDSLGMKLGKMYEAKILVEAGGGVGTIDFSTASMTVE
jgi:endo-1,4-beta-xylanase